MQGRIQCQSEVGTGTTFTVELPIIDRLESNYTENEVFQHDQDQNPNKNNIQRRILIVDDSKIVRRVLVGLFQKRKWQTEEAEDGKKGMEKFMNGEYDVVLMDKNMPGVMDGLKLTRLLRSFGEMTGRARKDLCLIGMTGEVEEVETKWKEAGVDRVLVKPLNSEGVLSCIDGFFDAG
eukprot:TRINITY_DN5461_c0_g1_i1.p2 TRINITY_DN5461_c0_g1~~TRINITY_DN5461_c0_g1_i1.p2  ORF type:complete len:178 (+),score=52.81 TRINITY_DN5461_c0_g1_i1:1404-1937(+)